MTKALTFSRSALPIDAIGAIKGVFSSPQVAPALARVLVLELSLFRMQLCWIGSHRIGSV